MVQRILSRRTFLSTTAGLSMATLVGGNDHSSATAASLNSSPAVAGPFQTGKVILGEGQMGKYALPQSFTLNGSPGFPAIYTDPPRHCNGVLVSPRLPREILAAVYFPTEHGETGQSLPASLAQGSFPIVLYAHAFRDPLGTACGGSHPSNRDFEGVETILRHVASYGCVVIAPDLSWIPGGFALNSPDYHTLAIALRVNVLLSYYQHLLAKLNMSLFDKRLDLWRVVMLGHSTGGPAAVEAGQLLAQHFLQLQSLCFGLIAPLPGVLYDAKSKLLVLQGTQDTKQIPAGAPYATYSASGSPKTLVTIPGANHFGYTDLCPPNNHAADVGLYDNNGLLPRDAQQLVAAAYLAALVRYYALGDPGARPYLSGETPIVALEDAGAYDIQVNSKGLFVAAP